MTLSNIITFNILSYYDGKIKNWIKNLKASGSQDGLLDKDDYTKLQGIETGAQVNDIETIKVDNSALTITDKTVNIDLSGKADKVTSATNGNFAGLDSNGNLTDSGSKASDFKTVQTAVADADATTSGEEVTFVDSVTQNTNGVVTVHKKTVKTVTASTSGTGGNAGLMTAAQAEKLGALPTNADLNTSLGSKADKVTSATDGNFAGLDSNGNLTDSGKAASDFATSTQGGYADSALQSISHGTDGSYVITTVGSKSGNNGAKGQTVGVAVTILSVSTADSTHLGLVEASDVKSYIDNKVSAGINYRGSVAKYSNLPSSNVNAGDMYNVKQDETISGQLYPGDMNYIWAAATGTQGESDYVAAHWDPQSPIIVLETATEAQIDGLFS